MTSRLKAKRPGAPVLNFGAITGSTTHTHNNSVHDEPVPYDSIIPSSEPTINRGGVSTGGGGNTIGSGDSVAADFLLANSSVYGVGLDYGQSHSSSSNAESENIAAATTTLAQELKNLSLSSSNTNVDHSISSSSSSPSHASPSTNGTAGTSSSSSSNSSSKAPPVVRRKVRKSSIDESGSSGASSNTPSEPRLDIKDSDLEKIHELGAGNGGTVSKVRYRPTGIIMARKIIPVGGGSNSDDTESKSSIRRRILRELEILHKCKNPHIVSFYGAFIDGGEVHICMEYMDCGSLDSVYRKMGPLNEAIGGKIAVSMLNGLVYLYQMFKIMHRDIKPSNVLINSKGEIKLADFGVSGQLVNSVANTFVGTSAYMSPERIQGKKYSVRSDVWSVGLTLLEISIGKFPFNLPETCAPFELLHCIVNDPAPTLPPGKFSRAFEEFIGKCLVKDSELRPSPKELLKHEFVLQAEKSTVDLEGWARTVYARLNN